MDSCFWWGWRGSPRSLRPACALRGAASWRRCPGRANRPQDALLIRPSSPFESTQKQRAHLTMDSCFWWGWRGSPRNLRPACAMRGAASWRRCPGRANRPQDALLIRPSSPFESTQKQRAHLTMDSCFWLNPHEVIQSRESWGWVQIGCGWVQNEIMQVRYTSSAYRRKYFNLISKSTQFSGFGSKSMMKGLGKDMFQL